MRFLISSLAAVLAILYSAAAFYFYTQEKWARSPSDAPPIVIPGLVHPEASLGVVREALDTDDFSASVVPALRESLAQAPSFYQPCFFVAAYYANRLEEPERVRRAFEAALKRYPANGRLHLAYGQQLLGSRSMLARLGGTTPPADPQRLAERQVEVALRLEPELTSAAIDILRQHGVPPERWEEITPKTFRAHRMLLSALAAAEGHRSAALALLRKMVEGAREPGFLEEAANYALAWKELHLALDIARRWRQEEAERESGGHASFAADLFLARTHLDLGEAESAERTFRDALERIERRRRPSGRDALELICAMGYEHLRRGHESSALSLFAEAVTVAPSNASAHLGLARTYIQLGETKPAVYEFRRVLQLEPAHREAESELRRLVLDDALGAREP